MKSIYEVKINSMINYYEELKKEFKWDGDSVKHLVALTYAIKDKTLNTDEIKDVKAYLKKETGTFSPFRGTMMFALCGLISAASETPTVYLQNMIDNLKILKSVGFKSSTYLPTALYALSTVYEGNDVEGFAEKAYEIYKEMKKNHPFLTSGDDYALAILLASTNQNPDLLETYYKALNAEGFYKSNGLQMLSHIMTFNKSDVNASVARCKRVLDELKKNKLRVSYDYYPAVGLISLIDQNHDEVVQDLIDVSKYLSQQKKYKWLGKGMHIMMASAIITSEYIKDNDGDVVSTAVTVSVQAIIAAQQAAMIAAITASTAAASAAT